MIGWLASFFNAIPANYLFMVMLIIASLIYFGVLTIVRTTHYPHMLWYVSGVALAAVTITGSLTNSMTHITIPTLFIGILFLVSVTVPLFVVYYAGYIPVSSLIVQSMVVTVVLLVWYIGMFLPFNFIWLRLSYFFIFYAPIFYACRARWREQFALEMAEENESSHRSDSEE